MTIILCSLAFYFAIIVTHGLTRGIKPKILFCRPEEQYVSISAQKSDILVFRDRYEVTNEMREYLGEVAVDLATAESIKRLCKEITPLIRRDQQESFKRGVTVYENSIVVLKS